MKESILPTPAKSPAPFDTTKFVNPTQVGGIESYQIGDGAGFAGTLGTGAVSNSAALIFARDGELTVTYRLLPDALEIEGSGHFATGAPPVQSELSVQILAAVVDEHELTSEGDEMRFRLRKKRMGS